MRVLGRAAGAVVLATLVACGSVKSSPDAGGDDIDAPESGDFTLAVDPASLEIPIASSSTVTVSVERTGGAGDVMLAASGAGANLTVEFSPNPLPAGSTTSTATITAKGGMAAASSTLTITGTAGDKTHSATVAITTKTITVTGTVRGGLAGIKVGIVGKPAVTSGAGGVFMFTDVTPPYDLYTVGPTGCGTNIDTVVHYFDDLTRNDPTVSAATPPVAMCSALTLPCGLTMTNPCKYAIATGTRAGAGNGTDPIIYAFTNGGFSQTAVSATSYTGSVNLGRADSAAGILYALQLTRKASGAPDTYLGFAKSGTVTFTKDMTTTVNLSASTVNSTFTLSGSVTGPAGYPAPSISLYQEFGTTRQSLWTTNETTTVDATLPVIPAAGGTSLYVSTNLDGSYSYYVHPLGGDTTVDFDMLPAAVPTAPASAASGVTTATPFTWTPAPGTISRVVFTSTDVAYYVYTTASETTIPAVAEAPLPSGQSFNWQVQGFGPNTSVDEAASANELETASSSDFQGAAHAYTTSPSRTFTTP